MMDAEREVAALGTGALPFWVDQTVFAIFPRLQVQGAGTRHSKLNLKSYLVLVSSSVYYSPGS